ncbi:MAG: ribosome-associated translation inhibitor RaiA [Phycisphaerae bacterium]|nr:ribosome-associated translation inhibitor RaiA [Phycisphaerae bacterium]
MRIEVRGKNLPMTPAISQYAETKCQRLPRYYDGVQQITVTIEKSAKHDEFTVEILADVEKHDDFVVRLTSHDVYEGLDLAIDKMVRQLVNFKERLKDPKH